MNKDLRDGREFFDGDPIDFYEGRFSGPFEIDSESGASISNGDLVTFIVTARVDTPKFAHVKKLGLKRCNTMKIISAIAIDADRARYLYDNAEINVEGVNSGIQETPNIDINQITISDILDQEDVFKEMS